MVQFGDGPRVGRPITGGPAWWSQWIGNKGNSTPVGVNAPPESLPRYDPASRLSIMQQRHAAGELDTPAASVDHGQIAFASNVLGGWFNLRRTMPIVRSANDTAAPNSTPAAVGGGSVATGTPVAPGSATDGSGTSSNDGANGTDPTVALEQSIMNGSVDTQPLGGIGATVPVEQQTIGAGSGNSSSLPVLALAAVAIGAIAFLYIKHKRKGEASGNATAS